MVTRTNDSEPNIVRRVALPVAVLAGLVGLARLSLRLVKEPEGPGDVLASVYDLVGQGASADAIRDRGLQTIPSVALTILTALILGIIGIWYLFWALNALVDALPQRVRESVRPYVYLLPAVSLLGFFLVFPAVWTVWLSFTEDRGWRNYLDAFQEADSRRALVNNVIWLIVATAGSVSIGLVIAQLFDRIKREALAKTFIFLPLAISMVGASVIWRFVYWWKPPGTGQIGVVNAVITKFDAEPVAVFQTVPINTLALIAIMIWLQTGFAMVILSAAIKGVPTEHLEAARLDGASELQVFTRVILPSIRPSIITVTTTIAVAVLKVFDIVYVLTGGKFQTDVIANRMYKEMFIFSNKGRASSLAVLLFLMVVPVMVLNLRSARRQEAMR